MGMLQRTACHMRSGAAQVIRAHMTASAVGPFSESFEWELGGAAEPVRLTIHGRAVPPTIKVLFIAFKGNDP